MRQKRAAEIQNALRQILYREWDPLGIAGEWPEDEYDAYIGGVYRILATSRSGEELITYLQEVVQNQMGLRTGERETLRQIAQRLLAVDIKL
jgi:hypothetical protein